MANKQPLILITNDDGITAPGILHLIAIAKTISNQIYVVAPDKPQSGMGHAITINAMLRIQPFQMDGVTAFSCTGTPVDCVKLAISKVVPRTPDLILSGVNHGSNSSINVIYSGTMSAAVEGAIEGVPSIGFSLCDHSIDAYFAPTGPYIKQIIEFALKNKMEKHTCWNVNFPSISSELIKGIRVCRQARAVWEEEFQERQDPSGKPYYWLTGKFVNHEPDREDTDEWALSQGYISLVPVQYDVTAYHVIDQIKGLENEK